MASFKQILLGFFLLLFHFALFETAAISEPIEGEAYLNDIKVSLYDPNILFLTVKIGKMTDLTDYYTLNMTSNNTLIGPYNETIYDKYVKKEMFTFDDYSEQTSVIKAEIGYNPSNRMNDLNVVVLRQNETISVDIPELNEHYEASAPTRYKYFSLDSINTTFVLLADENAETSETIAITFGVGNNVVSAKSISTEDWVNIGHGDEKRIYVKDDTLAPMIKVYNYYMYTSTLCVYYMYDHIQFTPRMSIAGPTSFVSLLNVSIKSITDENGRNLDIVSDIGIIDEIGPFLPNIRIDETAQILYKWTSSQKTITKWNLITNVKDEIDLSLVTYTISPPITTTHAPTDEPTEFPTSGPSKYPSTDPTIGPSINLTIHPSVNSTKEPSINPTTPSPTEIPTVFPTFYLSTGSSNDGRTPTSIPTTSTIVAKDGLSPQSNHTEIWIILSIMFFLVVACIVTFCCFARAKLKAQKAADNQKSIYQIGSVSMSNTRNQRKKAHFIDDDSIDIAPSMESDILNFLSSVGCEQYSDNFTSNGYNSLEKIKQQIHEPLDLVDIGINNEQHQIEIIHAIEQMQRGSEEVEGDMETNVKVTVGVIEGDAVTQSSNASTPGSEELRQWLNGIGLDQYFDLFVENGFGDHMDALSHLSEDHLKEMGISMMGHRLAILKSIAKL